MKMLLDGEPQELKPHKHGTWYYDIECCDCSLIHHLLIQHLKKETLTIKAYRDVFKTKKARKEGTHNV